MGLRSKQVTWLTKYGLQLRYSAGLSPASTSTPTHPGIRASLIIFLAFNLPLRLHNVNHYPNSRACMYNSFMKSLSLRAMSESQLAAYQSLQKGNDCTLHAISAAIEILCGILLKPEDLIEETNRLWWRGRLFRIFPKWAVAPGMQARYVNYLAKKHHLPIRAKKLHLDPETLLELNQDPNKVALVTLLWLRDKAPAIYYAKRPINVNPDQSIGGHTMLFAIYDPLHQNGPGRHTPWGFINSWVDGGNALFWMTDSDFKASWGLKVPIVGNHATVIIEHIGSNDA